MSLTIITPHFNNAGGIKDIYTMLLNQTVSNWEWIIVDDCSDKNDIKSLNSFFDKTNDSRVQLVLNSEKTNASVCRNMGITLSTNNSLIFLDSDDGITPNFVEHRSIKTQHFSVFKNMNIVDQKGTVTISNPPDSNYLDHFLNANFIWQTTAIVWNKDFLLKIGAFNPNLKRLQDIELSIRALYSTSNYEVLDNTIDFSYKVVPIRSKQNFVKPVCESVHYLVSHTLDNYALTKKQKHYVKAFYFMCTKYLERSEDRANIKFVKSQLKLFYKKGYFSFLDYLVGAFLLKVYKIRLISDSTFLKLNRYLFKTHVIS